MKKVLIDPGHGGRDPGAVNQGAEEKRVVQEIAWVINSELKKYDVQVVMTRHNNDTNVSLKQRTEMSKGCDFLVSIHTNSSANQSAKGFQSYLHPTHLPAEKSFAIDMQVEGEKIFGKTRWSRIETKNLHMVREAKCPAVLLECGFLSNSDDKTLLLKGSTQIALGLAITKVIVKHLGLKLKSGSTPTQPKTVTPVKKYTSIVDYLKNNGFDYSFANRKVLAQKMGIKNYTGTASQNMQLLKFYQG